MGSNNSLKTLSRIHYKPKEENTEKKFSCRVPGPDTRNLTTSHITHDRISPDMRHQENTQKKFLGRVLGPDEPDRRNLTTSHIIASHQTSDITSNHITHHKPKEENTKKKFLGRVLGPDGRKKRSQRRSSWEECLGRMSRIDAISPHHTSHIIASHQTSDITSNHITHHKPKEENTKKKFFGRVLGPDGRKKRSQRRSSWEECLGRMSRIDAISPHHTSHIIASHQTSDITSNHITHHKPKEENTKKKFLGRVLGPDGRKKRTQRRSSWEECLGRMSRIDAISPHHTSHIIASHQTSDITSNHITHHKPKEENTKKKFLVGPDGILTASHIITSHHIRHHQPKGRKSTSFIMKTPLRTIRDQ